MVTMHARFKSEPSPAAVTSTVLESRVKLTFYAWRPLELALLFIGLKLRLAPAVRVIIRNHFRKMSNGAGTVM